MIISGHVFLVCKPAYCGINCSGHCKYPHFLNGSQQRCNSLEKECNFSIGCSNKWVCLMSMYRKYIVFNNLECTYDKLENNHNRVFERVKILNILISPPHARKQIEMCTRIASFLSFLVDSTL